MREGGGRKVAPTGFEATESWFEVWKTGAPNPSIHPTNVFDHLC